MMADREARKKKSKAEKPSSTSVPNSEPESSQLVETANHEAEGSQESLSHKEQVKLIGRIFHDVVSDRVDRKHDPHRLAVTRALFTLSSAVQDGQGVGFLKDVYNPERSIKDNVSEAVQKLTAKFVEDRIGDRTDGRRYALDAASADDFGLHEAAVTEILSAYFCDPKKAAEARRIIAEGFSDDQKDEIMLKGKHLGFMYRHGKVRWSLIGEEELREGAKPISLKERLDFVEWLQEDLQGQNSVRDENPDVGKRKEELATAFKYLQEEISAAMEPGYLPDEEREFLEKQFSERPGWRPEITPELYLSRVLALKALGAEQSLKSGWTDQPDNYRMKELAHSIYREFGDEEAAGRSDKIEWAYIKILDLEELLKMATCKSCLSWLTINGPNHQKPDKTRLLSRGGFY